MRTHGATLRGLVTEASTHLLQATLQPLAGSSTAPPAAASCGGLGCLGFFFRAAPTAVIFTDTLGLPAAARLCACFLELASAKIIRATALPATRQRFAKLPGAKIIRPAAARQSTQCSAKLTRAKVVWAGARIAQPAQGITKTPCAKVIT